jgi:HEAT repeat protein
LSKAAPASITYKTTQPVRQFITSGSANEQVPDESIFCHQFIAALKGEGDTNEDGYVTGTELGSFLEDTVINYSKGAQHPQYGKIRDPNLDKGDFVFQVHIVIGTATSLPTPPPGDPEAEMWELVKNSNNISDMQDFLDAYPQGRFAKVARLKLKQLERQPVDANENGSIDKEDISVVSKLIHQLKYGERDERINAARELGKIGDKRAVEPLTTALKDEQILDAAVEALGMIGEPAIPSLLIAFKDEQMQEGAAFALARIGEPAIPSLLTALKDEQIQRMAAVALATIGEPAIPSLLTALKDTQMQVMAAFALGTIGEPAIPSLLTALKDTQMQVMAVFALARVGEPAIPSLLTALKDEQMRVMAIGVLSRIGEPAIPSLLTALRDEQIQRMAVIALVLMGEPAIPSLITTLKDEDKVIRRIAAEILGEIGDKRAVAPLTAALKDEDELVRKNAAEALEKIRYKK